MEFHCGKFSLMCSSSQVSGKTLQVFDNHDAGLPGHSAWKIPRVSPKVEGPGLGPHVWPLNISLVL